MEPGKELDTAKMYRVAADKFILNITFAWEHAVAITDNNDAGKLVSHRFPQFSFNPKLKPHFFKYLMLDKKFREHLELSSPGGAGRNRVLKISDMLKYEIKLPSIEEQIKIGEYFDSLDNLITLHQRKCEQTKKLKKYMLQKMFPRNGAKVPEIRFDGFTYDWEQRKFSELVTIERGGSPRPIDKFITNDENGLNWVKIGDAPEQGNYITQTAEKIRPEGLSKTREVHPGDLILSNSMSFGRPYIMAIDGCIHDGWLAIRDTKKNFDLKFLCTLLGTDSMLNQYKAMAAGSTVNNLNKELVGGTIIAFPMLEEQIKIGDYFTSIDHLITLHHRKCEEMKILKKYMLQKMFPQNGNSVPEIRFLGFTEDWEQRKFKELCDMVTVGIANSATHAYSDSGVVMFRNQNIKPNFLDDTDIIHINSEFEVKYKNKRLKKNDLLVARTGYPGTACVVPEKYENSQTFTTLIARPNENVDPYFLCQYLNSDIGIKYFESTQIGGGQKNSGAGILNEMPVTLPSTIEEEKQIADYFIQLDHLITLHHRKQICV